MAGLPQLQALEALNIIGPYVGGDRALMQRAAGSSAEGEAALDYFRTDAARKRTE